MWYARISPSTPRPLGTRPGAPDPDSRMAPAGSSPWIPGFWVEGIGDSMAYRFLLSVPTTLVDDANIAVSQADDAQVLVVRNSHGLGFDDPYSDLTVAAHSLRVVATIYDWFEAMGPDRPAIALVLHGGDRLPLADHDRGSMVAAIRRDQPWVERTLPRIGQHAHDEIRTPVAAVTTAGPLTQADQGAPMSSAASTAIADLADVSTPGPAPTERSWGILRPEERAPRSVAIRELNHIAVRVTDLARAEAFYANFFGMDLVARGVKGDGDRLDLVGPGYVWAEASATGREADVAFLRNGPLVLALHRVGRGARLERDVLDHISIRVEPGTFRQLKGEALMRSMEILSATDRAIVVRDPFFLTWEISVDALPESLA